ncbi:MAG: hypothetical protein KAR40_02925 [Candidatus Sabulitectum sp.]|nr:hypothetical protein [Candidatus Sabulitectum sp.]
MVVGLIAGFVSGATVVYFICWNLMRKKGKATSEVVTALTSAARKATGEVSKLRLQVQVLEKLERDGSDLILLFPDIIKKIFAGRDSDEVVSFVNRACQNLLKADESAVFLADRTGVRLSLSASTGLSDVLDKHVNLGLGEGFVGMAAETGRLLFRDELEKESVLVRRKIIMSDIPDFKPEYAAPMQVEGVLYGVITAGSFETAGILRKETLRAIAAVGAAALENVRVLERLGRSSSLDPETGFAGKTALEPTLENELERVERFGSNLTVIELNLYSAEMDTLTSRQIIGVAAKHLIASLRNIDIGIRTGRGSIILLLPGTDADGMKSVTGKLGGELPILKAGNGTHVGSIGMRSIVVEGGSRFDARRLLDRLRSQELMEFEGYYEI